MPKCQKIPPGVKDHKEIRSCICIPNPDGWYGPATGCRGCLAPGSYKDDDFFDNMARTVTQLFVSCTEVGGSVLSDGSSICAGNAYFTACTGLREGGKTGQASWASYELYARKGVTAARGNGTFLLDSAEYVETGSTSSSRSAVESSLESPTSTFPSSSTSSTTSRVEFPTLSSPFNNFSAPFRGRLFTTTSSPITATSSPTSTSTSGSIVSGPSLAMGLMGIRVEPAMGLIVALGVGTHLVV
ncbi:hypothetical protein B0H63DRAFT_316130 [Podospora didyma]|uniref:Uncharacterized protein n=1 Tax=Podospora didyma TaxID=330526 RepID=A0AAE0K6E0_9PEZI|nr:hypothetical protein B0H63DRAFT_316130 [Podospora didyma]